VEKRFRLALDIYNDTDPVGVELFPRASGVGGITTSAAPAIFPSGGGPSGACSLEQSGITLKTSVQATKPQKNH
jgi:hypothetical protein